jgi:hypothetical protein
MHTLPRGKIAVLDAALKYARRGWRVLPVHSIRAGCCTCSHPDCKSSGKHPRTAHGASDATTDPAIIMEWWRRWPDVNVGIATGAASGFVALDIDPRHGGDDSLADLERRHGPLPETIESLTGGGGRHILLAHPGTRVPNKAGLAAGLDVRGDGGYIVAPPSLHTSGQRYTWEGCRHPDDVPLAPVPGWVLALFNERQDRLCRDAAPLHIQEGARNATLFRLGCALRCYGLSEAAVAGSLEVINRHHCRPPLPDSEVCEIARSAARYPAGTVPEMSGGLSRMRIRVA